MTLQTTGLRTAADRLEALAGQLVAIDCDGTGRPSEKAAQDLGHAVVRFALALSDLAAWSDATHLYYGDVFAGRPAADPLAEEHAELALLSAILAGDVALDAFAWAELVRRGRARLRRRGDGKIPPLWPLLLDELEASAADPADRMLRLARLLDVNLDAARDAIVAHRDPELWNVAQSGSIGDAATPLGLSLVTFDHERLRTALRVLVRVVPGVLGPAPDDLPEGGLRDAYEDVASFAAAVASELGPGARQDLRTAFRLGGIETRPLDAVAGWLADLVALYLECRREEPARA